MDDQTPQESAKSEEVKREMYRKSLDTIKVYNPTDQDYIVDWDGFAHRIKAKSQQSFPRYIAEKYVREMKDKLITEMQDKAVKEAKEKFQARGTSASEITYLANEATMTSFRTSDPELIKKIYAEIWLGVEEKYGVDADLPQAPGRADDRPVEEQILGDLDRAYAPTINATAPETPQDASEDKSYPINKKKVVDEVSA